MLASLHDALENKSKVLIQRFDGALRTVARRSVRVWFNRSRLDHELTAVRDAFPLCELVYAIDIDGRQISSNIQQDAIDENAYGQDLSRRPITVSLSSLSNSNSRGAFLCDAYVSRVTRRPCVTVMYSVTSRSTLMGYIAADFNPDDLTRTA